MGAGVVFGGGVAAYRAFAPVAAMHAGDSGGVERVERGLPEESGGAWTGTAKAGYRGKWAEFTFEDIEGKDDKELMEALKLEGIDMSAVRALRRAMRVVYSNADREAKLEAVRELKAALGVDIDLSGIAQDSTLVKGPGGLALRMGEKARGIIASLKEAFTRYYDALLREFSD